VRGLFVTGTDTGIGKTVLSAALLLRFPEACYWKPIQTGPDSDTAEVRRLSGGEVFDQGIRHPDPVSPHHSRIPIDLGDLVTQVPRDPIIVEGAGGVLVPVNDTQTMADFMALLGLPAVVAVRTTLGTINHTVLSLEALRARGLAVGGVVMIGECNVANRAAIEHYGRVRVLAEMPRFDPLTRESLTAWSDNLPKDLIA
jgi:dethiobiotin synthase